MPPSSSGDTRLRASAKINAPRPTMPNMMRHHRSPALRRVMDDEPPFFRGAATGAGVGSGDGAGAGAGVGRGVGAGAGRAVGRGVGSE